MYVLADKKCDFRALRAKVGMVFQYLEYQLFAETVFEDVAFGLKNFECVDIKKEALKLIDFKKFNGIVFCWKMNFFYLTYGINVIKDFKCKKWFTHGKVYIK